ncbi:uncharacterized protein N7446_000467 [Penicillium canescens]|uniref:Uncharacterized protein n=1 Tax=Penicillium canescens TaxID=5083 RepID=A0AAD6I456_PENCN|nr:uncharacterized protein N7446_000467 [Penicillium canescens]KAJ6030470.1 hypothetical protein N7460_010736 [Penicillium canescens]KAJ6060845.1 hypothetical protein N7444_002699 [Penicillium canescens]KAJ6077531.1 hypothetical protein N7446_000467 [Penicillium canescens]
MLGRTSGPAARSARQQLQSKARFINSRFQSTASTAASTGSNPALIGGVAGGAVAFVMGYTWYHYSGAKTLVNTSKQTQAYLDQAKQTISQKAPEPNEAFRWLRGTTKSYAVLIPGARGYVDTVFDDLEKIKNDHGKEFDEVKHAKQLFDLAGDAAENVLNDHPQLKEKVGGSFDQLKEMGDAYGPQAKEEVNKTWQQISGILQRGASVDSAEDIKKLIQEKKTKLEKLGDEAWQKGFEESRQYLDKSPKLKQIVEDNADTLKKGNLQDLWDLVKESASSGKTEDVEKYIKDKVGQAKKSSLGDLDWQKMVPGGSSVIPQLQSLQSIAQKRGSEAEEVLKQTVEEIQDVLKKRKEQVEKIAEEGKEDSK